MTVAKARSISAAARMLNVSQPALGLQVKDLETRTGVSLFERHARGVDLTEAGKMFHAHALDVLSAMERAERSLAPFTAGRYAAIAIGVTPTLGRVLLEDLIAEEGRPGAHLELREALTSELIRLLRDGQIDAAFCYDPPMDGSYETLPLFEEDLVLVGRPGLPHFAERIVLGDLFRFPLALGPKHDASRQAIERAAAQQHVALDIRAEIAPISLKREMLIRRGLCSIVPYGLFLPDIATGVLQAAVITPPIRRTMMLATRLDLPAGARLDLVSLARKAVEIRTSQNQLGWRILP